MHQGSRKTHFLIEDLLANNVCQINYTVPWQQICCGQISWLSIHHKWSQCQSSKDRAELGHCRSKCTFSSIQARPCCHRLCNSGRIQTSSQHRLCSQPWNLQHSSQPEFGLLKKICYIDHSGFLLNVISPETHLCHNPSKFMTRNQRPFCVSKVILCIMHICMTDATKFYVKFNIIVPCHTTLDWQWLQQS